MKFANGDEYEGSFLNDLKHNKGKYIYKNGTLYEGNIVGFKI
jgi:hypothetical protein